MNEYETRLFAEHSMKNADVKLDFFDKDAIEIIAAFTRGKRRILINNAAMTLEQVFYHEKRTFTSGILYNSDRFNESELNGGGREGILSPRDSSVRQTAAYTQ